MKKLLPKTLENPQGFTLIELLVVVGIIAVLSVIGFAVFSNSASRARDSQRRADINAIADALENKKNDPAAPSTSYISIAGNDISTGKIPTEPVSTQKYCIKTATTGNPEADPTAWAASTNCPSAPAGYIDVAAAGGVTSIPAGTTIWKACALLENGTNPTVFCRISATK